MKAPEIFVEWMSSNIANDNKYGRRVFRYHPRSDEHSKMICRLVLEDLFVSCPELSDHAKNRVVVGGINCKYTFSNRKTKSLDLAMGTPSEPPDKEQFVGPLLKAPLESLRISCEAKQCMTEHGKTKPRLFDELSSSHEIVHQGDTNAIAAGIVVINIAESFASPLRQTSGEGPLEITQHRQPHVTADMIAHLRGLIMRDSVGEIGFDAFAIIVINCDNLGPCTLHTDAPAPQSGDSHHYDTFVSRITEAYASRFS